MNPDPRSGWKTWLEALHCEPGEGGDSALLERVADRVMDNVRIMPGDAVLDLGAGTGLLTFRAACSVGVGGSVTALDESAECLGAIQRESASMKLQNVRVARGRLESLPFERGAFDRVVCRSALVYSSDLGAAAGEVMRVLAPGGRFSVFEPLAGEASWTGAASEAFLALERLLRESGGPRMVDRSAVRSAFEEAGPRELESLVVHFRFSMEGRPAAEIAEEYLFDLPGELGALYTLKGSVSEAAVRKAVDDFAVAASAGELKGTLPCIFVYGSAR